jgi:hypothetical protein
MSEAAASIILAFNAGVMLGIGLASSSWSLVFGGAAILFATTYYYHSFIKPKEKS